MHNVAKEVLDISVDARNIPSYFDLNYQLTGVRQEFEWMAFCPIMMQHELLKKLHLSYVSFLKGNGGRPKWAKKGLYKSLNIKFIKRGSTKDRIKIQKIGELRFWNHNPIPENAKIKSGNIKKEFDGWWLTLSVEEDAPQFKPASESQAVGLDWGVKRFMTLSTGEFYENPKFYDKYRKELRRLNRSLARKKKGSHNWKKR